MSPLGAWLMPAPAPVAASPSSGRTQSGEPVVRLLAALAEEWSAPSPRLCCWPAPTTNSRRAADRAVLRGGDHHQPAGLHIHPRRSWCHQSPYPLIAALGWIPVVPAALTNEDGTALNGLIRAQNDHLRSSLLKLAALSQLRIVLPDLYGLFYEILALRLRLPRCDLAGHSRPTRGGVFPVEGLLVSRSACSGGSPCPADPVSLTLPLSGRQMPVSESTNLLEACPLKGLVRKMIP